jgi:hypothetical protein
LYDGQKKAGGNKVMASLKRIYLDTNPLLQAKWPKLSSLLETVLNLAKLENVEIYLLDTPIWIQ